MSVSIHAPTRGATIFKACDISIPLFQSTHPHGVRQPLCVVIIAAVEFQSTHPHGVRHLAVGFDNRRSSVSIHAPTRGATVQKQKRATRLLVSIHAPTRGATSALSLAILLCLFQSTHPHGVRQGIGSYFRGNTWFQSTHPHGVRREWLRAVRTLFRFQSTHPHGVRRTASFILGLFDNGFNPRTHTGCDLDGHKIDEF